MPQKVLDCRPGLGELNQVYAPNRPTPSAWSICGKYINIFTKCTIRKQHDILKTAVADVSKGQTDMSHKGELQKLNFPHDHITLHKVNLSIIVRDGHGPFCYF